MRPNIVFILTDNQSSWTLGCYGNNEIRTPCIDQLAKEGARFTEAFCTNPVCSPNRATLLTGLLPSQHGVHNWLGQEEPDAQMGPEAYCTIGEFDTLPQILANEGYDCGMCGKWHLGDSMNPQEGFRYWFAKPEGETRRFYDEKAIWQGQIYREPRYYLDAITHHALDFLRQPRQAPFFLYVGYNAPYGLDRDMRDGHRNRHAAYYADKELRCFPRDSRHPWMVQNLDCYENPTVRRSYACAVSGVDDGVGAILEELRKNGLEENTLVVFSADHGFCGGHHGMWGMGDHSRPLLMFQENLRVPLIFRHPARIPAGQTISSLTCHYDFLPSILDYLDLDRLTPLNPLGPGRSFAPALIGRDLHWGPEIVFHEYENTRAVQTPRWKLVLRHPDGPDELYDLEGDPGERRNLCDDPEHAEVLLTLTDGLHGFFGRFNLPEYDLWQEGRSKAGRILEERIETP
ncbi:sulfatase-like hydrolase/transferase [bacterium]|nr:sulfatase-like hydrolase/transferase [bacterium]